MNQNERRRYLIQELIQENAGYKEGMIPESEEEQKRLLRGLMNVRLPGEMNREFLAVQDAYLKAETAAKGITDIDSLEPAGKGLYLWQGDITTLRCDAIVNAANGGLTGCYIPNHRCIDNCIHSYSGIQLRMECSAIMNQQGHEEPAVQTVKEFMKKDTSIKKVVFNVFQDLDREIYKRLLGAS